MSLQTWENVSPKRKQQSKSKQHDLKWFINIKTKYFKMENIHNLRIDRQTDNTGHPIQHIN